jgi:uncharacterized protein YbjT (DUF2867 family)
MARNTISNLDAPVLVVGSTGKTGRRVAQGLRAEGVPVREGSRRSEIPFDWEDAATWAPALEGVRAAYVSFHPDLAVPGADDAIRTFTRLAVEAGVDHLVLLSGRGEAEARKCEEIVEQSGVTWTVIRASWFMQNFSEGFLRDMILDGTVALPVGDVREPFVDVDDIAEIAIRALMSTDLDDQLFEVTGPRLMTFAEATSEIAARSGTDLQFVEISHEDFVAGMKSAGVPGAYVDLVGFLFQEVLDGRNASTTDGVERALGRAPRDFAVYLDGARSAWTAEVA